MNTINYDSYSRSLAQVVGAEGKLYLSESADKTSYVTVPTEAEATLKPDGVAELADQALHAIEETTTLTHAEKSAKAGELARHVGRYADQNRSVAVRLKDTAEDADYCASEHRRMARALDATFQDYKNRLRAEAATPVHILTDFCFTLLDSMPCPDFADQGGDATLGMHYAIESIQRYLREKREVIPEAEKGQILQAMKELIAAKERLGMLYAHELHRDPVAKKAAIKELALHCSRDVAELLHHPEADKRFLINGGFRSKDGGHAVMVEIRVDPVTKRSLQLSIVNTGSGVQDEVLDFEGLKSAELHGRPMFSDTRYINLQPESFTPEFFESYFDVSYVKQATSMKPFLDFLQKALLKKAEDGTTNLTTGRQHKVQRKGSCSVKAMQSWIHHRQGRMAYFRYKVEMTKYKIETFKALGNQVALYALPKEQEEMLCSAEKIQKKRERKLEQILLHEAPAGGASLRAMGDIFAQNHEWTFAIQQYNEWIAAAAPTKNDLPSLLLWAEAHMASHKLDRAIEVAMRAWKLTEADEKLDYDLITTMTRLRFAEFEKTGDHRALLQFLEQPRVVKAAHPVAQEHHVKMLFQLKRYPQAEAYCDQALAANPVSVTLHVLKAKALFNQKKSLEVLQLCEEVRKLPDSRRSTQFIHDMQCYVERQMQGEEISVH